MQMFRTVLDFLFSNEIRYFDDSFLNELEQSYRTAKRYEFLSLNVPRNVYTPNHTIKLIKLNSNQRNAIWNYLNAAIKGHVEAQYTLGMIYLNGALGTDRNYRYADQWLNKAKQRGHQGAAHALEKAYSQLAI